MKWIHVLILLFTLTWAKNAVLTNYAAGELGASVVSSPPLLHNASAILAHSKDRYASFRFSSPFDIDIHLTSPITVTGFRITNLEMMSSSVSKFELFLATEWLGAQTEWKSLGIFDVSGTHADLPIDGGLAGAYIRLRVLETNKRASITTITSVSVFGKAGLQRLEDLLRGTAPVNTNTTTPVPAPAPAPQTPPSSAFADPVDQLAGRILDLGATSAELVEAVNSIRGLLAVLQQRVAAMPALQRGIDDVGRRISAVDGEVLEREERMKIEFQSEIEHLKNDLAALRVTSLAICFVSLSLSIPLSVLIVKSLSTTRYLPSSPRALSPRVLSRAPSPPQTPPLPLPLPRARASSTLVASPALDACAALINDQ